MARPPGVQARVVSERPHGEFPGGLDGERADGAMVEGGRGSGKGAMAGGRGDGRGFVLYA